MLQSACLAAVHKKLQLDSLARHTHRRATMDIEKPNRRRADDAGEPLKIPAGELAEVVSTTQLGTHSENRNVWSYPLVEVGTICMVTGGPEHPGGTPSHEQRYWVIVPIKGEQRKGWLYESELRQITSIDECV